MFELGIWRCLITIIVQNDKKRFKRNKIVLTFWINALFSEETQQSSLFFWQLSISVSSLSSPVLRLSFLRLLFSDDGLSDLILTLSSLSSDIMYFEPRQQKFCNNRFIARCPFEFDSTKQGTLKQLGLIELRRSGIWKNENFEQLVQSTKWILNIKLLFILVFGTNKQKDEWHYFMKSRHRHEETINLSTHFLIPF